MSELAVPERGAVAQNSPDVQPTHMPPQVMQPAQSALVAWAQEAGQANQIAIQLARTSFVPASLRNKPDDITAAILAGLELGLQPMATLRSIDVIQGTPALRAHAMRGLVQSRGHEIEVKESTDEYCKVRGRRAGAESWQYVEWTIERAQRLGLTGKDQWKKQPKTMLVARATGEICRMIASDVLYAMPFATEELDADQAGFRNIKGTPGRVTAAEILAAQAESVPAEPQSEAPAEPTGQPELTNWQKAWISAADAAKALGWDRDRMEAEFQKANNNLAVNDASVEDLAAFVEYLQTINAEAGAA